MEAVAEIEAVVADVAVVEVEVVGLANAERENVKVTVDASASGAGRRTTWWQIVRSRLRTVRVEPQLKLTPRAGPRDLRAHHAQATQLLGVMPLFWNVRRPQTPTRVSRGQVMSAGASDPIGEPRTLQASAFGRAQTGLQLGLVL